MGIKVGRVLRTRSKQLVSTYVFGVRGAPTRASGYHSPPICPFTQNLGRIGRAGRLGSKKFQNSSAWCAVYLGVQAEEGEVIATSAPSWAYVITITLPCMVCFSDCTPYLQYYYNIVMGTPVEWLTRLKFYKFFMNIQNWSNDLSISETCPCPKFVNVQIFFKFFVLLCTFVQ